MKIIRCEQVTQEWFDLHLGRCTASHAKAILRDDLAPYSDYLEKKVAEILTGKSPRIALQISRCSGESITKPKHDGPIRFPKEFLSSRLGL